MKKRRKGRIREFEHNGMQRSMEESRRERQERRTPEPETSTPRRKKKRLKINRGRIILTVIVVALIAVLGVSVKNIFDLRAEQKELQEKNKSLQQEAEALQEELENVNDLDYIEEQARIQLRMIKPGEILYILDGNNNQEEGKDKDSEEDN